MKKLLSLILCVGLLLSVISASAETFTLRNGIAFGDSMEDVMSKETIPIDSIDDEFGEFDEEEDYPYYIKTEEDTVAGISGSAIIYQFDKDKKLRDIKYAFPFSSSKDVIESHYESVNSGLVRKYGAPLGYSDGTRYIISGSAIDGAVEAYRLNQLFGGIGDLLDYDEWVVNSDEYNIKIEQVCYYYAAPNSNIEYGHGLSYTYFTDEMLQKEQDAKQERQDAVDNDL